MKKRNRNKNLVLANFLSLIFLFPHIFLNSFSFNDINIKNKKKTNYSYSLDDTAADCIKPKYIHLIHKCSHTNSNAIFHLLLLSVDIKSSPNITASATLSPLAVYGLKLLSFFQSFPMIQILNKNDVRTPSHNPKFSLDNKTATQC